MKINLLGKMKGLSLDLVSPEPAKIPDNSIPAHPNEKIPVIAKSIILAFSSL